MNADTHEWEENKDGFWCQACGELIAAPWHIKEKGYEPPDRCPNCGWPDEFDPEAV